MRASQPILTVYGVKRIFRAVLKSALLLLVAHCSLLTICAQASEPIETLRMLLSW